MNWFDTHMHVYRGQSAEEVAGLVERATAAGVTSMVAVGGSEDLNAGALRLAAMHPGGVWATVGFDRDHADLSAGVVCEQLQAAMAAAAAAGVTPVAIGEIGMDLHYHPDTADAQAAIFSSQLAIAREAGLPVVVHSREAEDICLSILKAYAADVPDGRCPGVLHCFTGSAGFAEALIACGFMISFSGIVTFRKADPLREVAAAVPADRILVETDSPYLAPVPLRGQRNEPAYLPHVGTCVAGVRGVDPAELAEITHRNARRLFGL